MASIGIIMEAQGQKSILMWTLTTYTRTSKLKEKYFVIIEHQRLFVGQKDHLALQFPRPSLALSMRFYKAKILHAYTEHMYASCV